MAKPKAKKHLVIVESPAKARTLSGMLGPGYEVRASVGHVRDLPKSRLGVDLDNDFQPHYIVPPEKREIVRKLREAVSSADTVFLATDPDREGEAISWHLVEATGMNGKTHRRVVFHEITPEAVRHAFRQPRDIDMHLVNAQQARRVLDRLVGYKISPLLWQKVRRGLSAGRVQSVALRMVVDREREIAAFVPKEYWTIDAWLSPDGDDRAFCANFVGLVGQRKMELPDQDTAQQIIDVLGTAAYAVHDVKRRQQARRPAPPFTTSTLQQEASRRFGFSAKRTMAVAQQLYEGRSLGSLGQVGLITYMRTDSTFLSEQAKQEARAYIADKYGKEFLPPSPRVYRKKAKGAQEAHEAIRPTSIAREPSSLRRLLTPDQHKLYTLIWQRTVASQMADALYDQTSVDIHATPTSGRHHYLLRATCSALRFPGFRKLYHEMTDSPEEEDGRLVPDLQPGDALRLVELKPEQHFTEPPARYTEATLVKALEENGIGRPSTYAPILSTLQDRGYVTKDGRSLKPEELGFVVSDLLTDLFPDVVDVKFTADMEENLDEVARGQRPWQPVVHEFYRPLQKALTQAEAAPPVQEVTEEVCDKCGRPMVARWGRFGRFLACSGYPECKNTRPLDGEQPLAEESEERCDLCGAPMLIRRGRFGRFLACSRYPECTGKRPLVVKVGVPCPKDGGDIVEKRSRKGRTFYGCANYPACDFTTWSRPLRAPCPSCESVLVAQPGGKARCTNCGWRGPAPTTDQELAEATA